MRPGESDGGTDRGEVVASPEVENPRQKRPVDPAKAERKRERARARARERRRTDPAYVERLRQAKARHWARHRDGPNAERRRERWNAWSREKRRSDPEYAERERQKWARYYERHGERRNAAAREAYHNDPEKRRAKLKQRQKYHEKNKGAISDRQRVYYKENRARLRARNYNYQLKQYKQNPNYRIAINLRCRMYDALRAQNAARAGRYCDLLGCTPRELRERIESLFLPGMSWDNRPEWHVDHIRPCSSFDLTDPAQQRACFHHSNLRPLWAADNLRKGKTVSPPPD